MIERPDPAGSCPEAALLVHLGYAALFADLQAEQELRAASVIGAWDFPDVGDEVGVV